MLPAIEIRNLSKAYGAVQALSAVDLNIPQGEFFALLGPNGAGKTTLISLIAKRIGQVRMIANASANVTSRTSIDPPRAHPAPGPL